MTKKYFTIKTSRKFADERKTHSIDFMLQYDEDGNTIDGEGRNPCGGWTNYTQWHQGWSEQDDDLETLLAAINEFSRSMELDTLIGELDESDLQQEYIYEYTCENFEDPDDNITYHFEITLYDIEEGDE